MSELISHHVRRKPHALVLCCCLINKAFVKETDGAQASNVLPDRPISVGAKSRHGEGARAD
jgi:hypothetical protein